MMPPPSGQSSWAWSTRSPSPYTTVSSKPNASTRNRMSARASRARSDGHTCGGGVFASVMGSILVEQGQTGLDKTELVRQPLRRRAARERAEVADQMRLIEVLRIGSHLGQPHTRGELPAYPV